MSINPEFRDSVCDLIAGMEINSMYIEDMRDGYHACVNLSKISLMLPIVIKTLLICAVDERPQKLTIDFDGKLVYTNLEYSNPSDAPVKTTSETQPTAPP